MLAGRRGDRAPSLKSPLLGLVLLAVGIAGSAFGAAQGAGGEFAIAASAIPAVLGMILLVPTVLTLVAKLSGRLPLVLRYAVRDANRHRTRTVPAVSAVAATVAGVVALGIGLSSDDAENEATYQPSVAAGVGIVTAYDPDVSWQSLRGVLDRELPGATVTEQQGLAEDGSYSEVFGPDGETVLDTSGGSLGANIMVSDDRLPVGLLGVAQADVPRAEQMLRQGGIVAFVSPGRSVDGDTATVVQHVFDPDTGEDSGTHRARLPAAFVRLTDAWAGPAAVVSTAAAEKLGAEPATVALAVTGDVLRAAGGGRQRGAGRGLRVRVAVRRARLPGRRRDGDRADRPAGPRRDPDARRHPDRDLPCSLRRAARPRDAVRCRRLAAHPAWGRCGVRPGGRPGRRGPGRRGRVHPRHRGHVAADQPGGRRTPARSSTSRG